MITMRKRIFGLVMAMAMLFGFSATAMAAETSKPITLDSKVVLSENQAYEGRSYIGIDPEFYSAKIYGYNSSTGDSKLLGEAEWRNGTKQPGYIEIPKTEYWKLSGEGYDKWMFEYTWKSNDCTYLKIYDKGSNEVYINATVKPNTNYTIRFYESSSISQVNLRCDATVPGFNINDMYIGGLKVKY